VTEESKQKRMRSLPKVASQSEIEIDSRLAQAIRDRAKAMAMVSKLVHWQDRLARLEQEINSLIGFQQRLTGQIDDSYKGVAPLMAPAGPPSFAGHLADIPPGVSSIPTKTARATPSGGNVADQFLDDKGFT
jgi:hypothetical protein